MRRLLLMLTFLSISFSYYEVGDTISIIDQHLELNVSYGDYPSETLKLVDFNGDFNGGDYRLIVFRMTATW